jgi:hypothetical protein
MAFAQLTYRESLRDIEACLLANRTKLYGMGFQNPVSRVGWARFCAHVVRLVVLPGVANFLRH